MTTAVAPDRGGVHHRLVVQIVTDVVLVGVVAFIVYSVWSGTWYGTWCASGRKASGRSYPGGPVSDPHRLPR